MIEAEGLTKYYGTVEALMDVSFQVEPGEILGLVGPNGAGKTTCLYLLAGLMPPSAGLVRIGGHLMIEEPIEAKRLLGLVPDEPMLFDYLTVAEHLEFVARMHGLKGVEERITRVLENLDLAEKRHDLPPKLSRGYKQRLALCCGLIHDPRAILLDEPLTGLDPGAIRRTKDALIERAKAGAAVILSSHQLALIEEMCDRILILREGRKAAFGSRAEIASLSPRLLADSSLEEIFLAVTESAPTGNPEENADR